MLKRTRWNKESICRWKGQVWSRTPCFVLPTEYTTRGDSSNIARQPGHQNCYDGIPRCCTSRTQNTHMIRIVSCAIFKWTIRIQKEESSNHSARCAPYIESEKTCVMWCGVWNTASLFLSTYHDISGVISSYIKEICSGWRNATNVPKYATPSRNILSLDPTG